MVSLAKMLLHSVSPDQHRIGVRILLHGGFQTAGQVLLEGSVLNDRDAESVVVSQHTLTLTTRDTLDLLDGANLKAGIGALLTLHQQGHQDGPLGVGVDTAASTVLESREEQRSAGGGVQLQGAANIVALFSGILLGGPLKHEDVLRLHELLLDPGRSNEDVIAMTNGGLLLVSGYGTLQRPAPA